MEQENIVSLHGATHSCADSDQSTADLLKELDRKVLRLHLRHAGSWLARVVFLVGAILIAVTYVTHPMGAVIIVVSGYLLWRAVISAIRGHRKIARYQKAKRYWLRNDSGSESLVAIGVTVDIDDQPRIEQAG